jgi:hypothetical protein
MSPNPELDPKLVENQQQKPSVNLDVTVDELNVLLAALQELPHRIADPILRKLIQQAQSQLGVNGGE